MIAADMQFVSLLYFVSSGIKEYIRLFALQCFSCLGACICLEGDFMCVDVNFQQEE